MRTAHLRFGVCQLLFLGAVLVGGALWAHGSQVRNAPENQARLGDAKISDVAWISGTWLSKKGEGRLEEVWSEPRGDSMMGMFRWIKKGEVWIYELMTIREEEGTLVFRFRHFGNDMMTWEPKTEPLTYRLKMLGVRKVVFENPESDSHRRYEISRPDDNTLAVRVGAYRNGKIGYSEFQYKRQ